MGVLVNYQFENISAADLALIGAALDALPHGKVQQLVAKMQAQITAQDAAERDKIRAAQDAAVEAFRESERVKLRAEMAAKPTSKRKGL